MLDPDYIVILGNSEVEAVDAFIILVIVYALVVDVKKQHVLENLLCLGQVSIIAANSNMQGNLTQNSWACLHVYKQCKDNYMLHASECWALSIYVCIYVYVCMVCMYVDK